MSSDANFVAQGPSPVGFKTRDGQPLNIQTGGFFEGRNVGVQAKGELGSGVASDSTFNDGIVGSTNSDGKSGVFGFAFGTSGARFGVSGNVNTPDGAAINGFSDPGVGVRGASKDNDGVVGSTNSAGRSGVFGFSFQQNGSTFGVSGSVASSDGAAINGFTDLGYGGSFRGARAALRLVPAGTRGHPTTGNHQRGEFVVDSNGDLFYCKDDGEPGRWFRVQLTPA